MLQELRQHGVYRSAANSKATPLVFRGTYIYVGGRKELHVSVSKDRFQRSMEISNPYLQSSRQQPGFWRGGAANEIKLGFDSARIQLLYTRYLYRTGPTSTGKSAPPHTLTRRSRNRTATS